GCAASDQSEARRKAQPLGGGALERADENAGGIVHRAAVLESEIQLGEQLLEESRLGEHREHESRITFHQALGKLLPHALRHERARACSSWVRGCRNTGKSLPTGL